MQRNLVIGLNSGTSFDGVDVVLVNFRKGSLKPYFKDGFVFKYPRAIKSKIQEIVTAKRSKRVREHLFLKEISQLNFLLGEVFADAALKIIKKNKLKSNNVLLIASHGQTIFHDPGKSTLQIGESSIIAHKTGINVVSNFREADITVGGQGAPLMPYLDWVVFGRGVLQRALLNIGGISNVTIAGNNIKPIAFDIGPGNALLDLLSKKYFNKDFDTDGMIAKRGKVFFKFIEYALKDPYFKKKPPKSTGKEYFNYNFIQKYFSSIKRKEDKLATLTYFTAKAIHKSFEDFVFPNYKINEVVMSGGGIKNKTLLKHLKRLLYPLKVVSSDKYGLPAQFKEAMLFALLGYTCIKRIKNNMPSCTGTKKRVILGKMTFVQMSS